MNKILIIEDDKDISNLLSIHLKDIGYETDNIYDGREGLLKALDNNHELIVLDLKLPGMDGMDICKKLRQEKILTPVIMLTSRSEEIDKVLGLEIGADDYITKPFSIREFMARVKALVRRQEQNKTKDGLERGDVIAAKDIMINIPKRVVKVYEKHIDLSPKEFDMLVLMASNPGKTYSRIDLLNQIWGVDFEGFEHTVNSHINRLRAKIEKDMDKPEFILTTWGVGYKFRDEV